VYLGIDIGTSSVKTVLVDEHERIAAQTSAPLTLSRPRSLFAEQDPEAWWQATLQAVSDLPRAERSAVRAIGLSGQMHGATLLDRRHRPLRPAILWCDGRSGAECLELERREPRSRSITGNLMLPGFTAPKLLWVAKHEPEIFARTALVLLPKDYVRLRLTGAAVSDLSDASGTGWLDVGQRDWSQALLAASHLTHAQVPSLVEGNAPSGELTSRIAEQLHLPRVVVAGGAGDNAASAVGLGIINPAQAFLSLGTSGVLFAVTDRFRPSAEQAAHAFCHCLPGRWHQMSVMLSAASALDWVARITGEADLQRLVAGAEAERLQQSSPVFLPYLSGERTPHNDPHARGVFFGLSAETTRAALVLAVLEGVALGFADGLDVMTQAGTSIDEIDITGGGARLPFWGRLLAAALDRRLNYRVGSELGAALGAARLARLARTGESPEAVCRLPPLRSTVEPEADLVALLAQRRVLFRRLYQDLKPRFQELDS
jgi:xylulokinase